MLTKLFIVIYYYLLLTTDISLKERTIIYA